VCAAEQLHRDCSEEQLFELRQAAAKDQLLSWLDFSGRADEVALQFALLTRQDVIQSLLHGLRPQPPQGKVAPDSRRADFDAVHAAMNFSGGAVVSIPLEVFARRGFFIGALIERGRVATSSNLELLSASCNRLLLHLEPIAADHLPGRGTAGRNGSAGAPKAVITAVDEKRRTMVVQGETIALMGEQYEMVMLIIQGRGQWVGLKKGYGFDRPDKTIKLIPEELRHLIKSKKGSGGGYRIDPAHVAPAVIKP